SAPAASPHPAGAGESNRAASRLNSRSSVRPTGSPPIPIHTRARARRPAEPPAPAPPPSTALLLPCLQFLKGWSLRQTRGDSIRSAQDRFYSSQPGVGFRDGG